MKLLAIDPGTRILGWAVFERGCLQSSGTITAKGNDLGKRLATIDGVFRALLTASKPDMLLHEEGMVHRSRDGARSLGEAMGIVRLAAFQAGVKMTKVNVSTWKKALTGNGAASKQCVHDTLTACCGVELSQERDKDGNYLDQDRADAIGIGMGWLAMEGER